MLEIKQEVNANADQVGAGETVHQVHTHHDHSVRYDLTGARIGELNIGTLHLHLCIGKAGAT